ncbi:hypothetical protein FRB95_006164 [Tulasnella sp. JGI-2019a]|nr:hypothetical protein FRB93_000377 [Tulasnella sp. JGI-2019a]KAG9028690.1 hypothetical protein FRB95_006164 [Tulasnella sp. JGI-2019a]
MGRSILTSIIGWLLLVVYPLIRTLMASISFAMGRQGSSQTLEKWIRFWIIAICIKIVEVILPMSLVYSIVKYIIIMSLASTWSPDLRKVLLWMMEEGPRLSARARGDLATVMEGLRAGMESYAAGAPINTNSNTPIPHPMAAATPLQLQSNTQDATSIFAAVEARRRQLEAELATLTKIQGGAAVGGVERMPEVVVD